MVIHLVKIYNLLTKITCNIKKKIQILLKLRYNLATSVLELANCDASEKEEGILFGLNHLDYPFILKRNKKY